jgi:hypothetical protein
VGDRLARQQVSVRGRRGRGGRRRGVNPATPGCNGRLRRPDSFIPIDGTIWIIAIAYLTIYQSFGSRTMNSVVLQLHSELEEAMTMPGGTGTEHMCG